MRHSLVVVFFAGCMTTAAARAEIRQIDLVHFSHTDYGYDWYDFSGAGHQVAWGVHHFDVVNWAMGATDPVSAVAMGGKYAMPDDNRFWPDTFDGILEYGPGPVANNGFVLQYTMRLGSRRDFRAHGKCFLGSNGSLFLDRAGYTITAEEREAENDLDRAPRGRDRLLLPRLHNPRGVAPRRRRRTGRRRSDRGLRGRGGCSRSRGRRRRRGKAACPSAGSSGWGAAPALSFSAIGSSPLHLSVN